MDLFNIPLCSLSVNDSGKRTFAGNPMINWICSKLLLISSFPTATAKPGGFLNNYYGGIQPVIWDDDLDEQFTNAGDKRWRRGADRS